MLLSLLAAWALGHPLLGVALFAAAAVNRMVESLVIGWGVVRDPMALRSPWLYPVRDVLGFMVWCASYVSKTAVWRDHRFELRCAGQVFVPGQPRFEAPGNAGRLGHSADTRRHVHHAVALLHEALAVGDHLDDLHRPDGQLLAVAPPR